MVRLLGVVLLPRLPPQPTMTAAPPPPVPAPDRWRQQIAEVLAEGVRFTDERGTPFARSYTPSEAANALLPLIAQARAEGAAEALSDAADEMPGYWIDPTKYRPLSIYGVAHWLRTRAAHAPRAPHAPSRQP